MAIYPSLFIAEIYSFERFEEWKFEFIILKIFNNNYIISLTIIEYILRRILNFFPRYVIYHYCFRSNKMK